MTTQAFSVQDGFGIYHADNYSHAVTIALADEVTACTILRNGKSVAFKRAHSAVIELPEEVAS